VSEQPARPDRIDADRLRSLCREAGADDVGLASIDAPGIAAQRDDILAFFPPARTLVSYAFRMNHEPLRTPARSLANLESKEAEHRVHHIGRAVVTALERDGVRAIHTAVAFPVEMTGLPAKVWPVSHKPVAVAAGLGHMGLNRCVIHPQFGDLILLGTVVVGVESTGYDQPLDGNPCIDCKLCASVCPTGAISLDGHFDFASCLTHNYREFFGGFTDWIEQIADSRNAVHYRERVPEIETASMWQSLVCGGTYKCLYCQSICPAGTDVIGGYNADRKAYVDEVVRPLREKKETVYVVPGSDAEAHVTSKLPWKTPRRVGSGIRARSIDKFLGALPLIFQRGRSEGLDATYHFTFTGTEERQATVVIRDQTIDVQYGHHGEPSIRVTADSAWWIGFLAKERNLLRGLITRKLRLRGSPSLMSAFAKCFPM
jgi:ferredoxin